MDDILNGEQCVKLCELGQDGFVRIIGGKSAEFARFFCKLAVAVHRNDYRNFGIMIYANLKVLHAVSRSGMNAAGTAFESDMVADDDGAYPVDKRMTILDILKLLALKGRFGNGIFGNLCGFHCAFNKLFCHDVVFAVCVYRNIFILRTEADCKVARQSPCGGGPNYEIGLIKLGIERGKLAAVVFDFEFYINRVAGILRILYLRFRKCGFAFRAPINRLQTFIDEVLLCHFAENADLLGFVLRL